MRKVVALLAATLCACLFSITAWSHPHPEDGQDGRHPFFPKLISLPKGFQPEGLVKGRGHKAYAGSLLTGAIYEADLVTGKGRLLIEQSDNAAVGLAYDRRSNFLFVAGGLSGHVTVYESEHGSMQGVFPLSESDSFINDGIVTANAAYFTDSFAPVIYKLPLSRHGGLPETDAVETIALNGDFQFIPGEFNGNGIESFHGYLVISHTANGNLYRVDPQTGETKKITITNGDATSGDGLWLHDRSLFVAQNFLNQISQLKLSTDGLSADIVHIITDPAFRVPTTITGFGKTLYTVNSRFDVAPPPFPGSPPADPGLTYNLVRVPLIDD